VSDTPVTLSLQEVAFPEAVRQLMETAGTAYRREGNIYIIGKRIRDLPVGSRVGLDLKEVPLRQALRQLFQGSGQRCAVELGVPDRPITLKVESEPFVSVLQRLVEKAGVRYRQEGEFYIIENRQPAAPRQE
jgi:hypothetical protein